MEEFTDRFRAFLKDEKGMSDAEIGEIISSDRKTVNGWWRGHSKPTTAQVIQIVRELKPDLYSLFGIDAQSNKGAESRGPGVIDAPLVSQLQEEVEKLKARNEALEDALVSMKNERDEAKEAAKTAGSLRNEATGA